MKSAIFKLLKKPFFGRFMVDWRNPLTDDQKKEWLSFSIQSQSGGIIKILFAPSLSENPKATIVMGHPMGKEAKGYFIKHGYADLLRSKGYNVLIFDLNGFGESSNGDFSYYYDIHAVGLKAREITPTLPIGYHGISMGGIWSILTFTNPNHVYTFAIIESASTSLGEFWKHFPMAYRTLQLFNVLMPNYRRQIHFEERVKHIKNLQSILYIYSNSDPWTPVEMGERFMNKTIIPAELWIVHQADHAGMMKSVHKDEYQKKIVEYFDRSSLLS